MWIVENIGINMGLKLGSINVPGAFAIATSNVGNAAAADVSFVVDAGTMPLVVQGKQTDPATGQIIGDAQHIAIGVGETPTFAIFYTPTAAIANDPANNRIQIKLVDGTGNILGSQSVAIRTVNTVTVQQSSMISNNRGSSTRGERIPLKRSA